MKIYESAVRKPVSTVLMFVGVMVFGLFSLSRLSVDQYPEIEIPQISVITMYPGANAADIVAALRTAHGWDARLHVVGRAGWGGEAERLKDRPGVVLHGYCEPETVRGLLADAHVFLSTSHDEGLGLPLLEAQYAGLPVVALAEMGTVDILGPRRASLAPPPEPEAFGEAVGRLLGDAPARQRLAADAPVYAAEWSDTEMAARLAWLYRDLLERHAPAALPAAAGA